MSDGTASNVRVGVVGGIYSGVIGSAYPSSRAQAISPTLHNTLISAGINPAGYASTDGVTQTIDSSTSQIRAWGGDAVRLVQSEHSVSYSFRVIESNEQTLKDYYGEDATAEEAHLTGKQLPPKVRVIVVRDGDKRIVIVLPHTEVTSRGDIQYYGEDAVGYELTVEAMPDGAGVKAYIYMGDVSYTRPTVTALSPTTGARTGSTVVTVTGTGFVDVSGVFFDGAPALAFDVKSPTSILAVSPPGSTGVVDVTVRAVGGVSAAVAGSKFTYTA